MFAASIKPRAGLAHAESPSREDPGWYCGIYAVYGALRAEGIQVTFESLLQPRYIASPSGSTLAELQRATLDQGAFAEPLGSMSPELLFAMEHPAVLHVTARDRPGLYMHWILFLGNEGGRARIVEASGHSELYRYPDLLAIWDGSGLIVSRRPLHLFELQLRGIAASTLPVLAVAVVILLVSMVQESLYLAPRSRIRVYLIELLLVVLCSSVVGFAHHFCSRNSGLLSERSARNTVLLAHRVTTLPQVDYPDLARFVRDKRCIVIDARRANDYQRGHIPGARSIPIDLGPAGRAAVLNGIDRTTPLVVYCQSEDCPYDDSVAAALMADGFQNISLFPAGWQGWQARQAPPANTTSAPE